MSASPGPATDLLIALLPRLRRLARALVDDPPAADELVRVAIERAHARADQWRSEKSPELWIFGILQAAWIDERRALRQPKQALLPEDSAVTATDRESEAPIPRLSLEAAMERLSDEQRPVIALVLVEGLTYEEATDVLELPIDTVVSHLERARAEVEAAMALEPDIARRVQDAQALRRQFSATYDRLLLETVPDRLIAAARRPVQREATVTDLRRVRAARKAGAAQAAAAARRVQPPRPPWGWFEWGAMVVSAATGVLFAYLAIESPDTERFTTEHGQLIARADLDLALSNQLASDPIPGSSVRIGVSFESKKGTRCRTFLVKDLHPVGGLACREGGEWKLQVIAHAERPTPPASDPQQAGPEMPAAVLAAAQNLIDGEPFDANHEVAARERGWEE